MLLNNNDHSVWFLILSGFIGIAIGIFTSKFKPKK